MTRCSSFGCVLSLLSRREPLTTPTDPLESFRNELKLHVEEILGMGVTWPILSWCMELKSNQENIGKEKWFAEFGREVVERELRVAIESVCDEVEIMDRVPQTDRLMPASRAVEQLMDSERFIALGEYRIELLDSFPHGSSTVVYRARSGMRPFALKCRRSLSFTRTEYNYLVKFKSEPWAPDPIIPPTLTSSGLAKCFGMQLFTGGTLQAHPRNSAGVVDWAVLSKLAVKMIHILRKLHEVYGVVHGDVHDGNWVLDEERNVFLIDYEYTQPKTPERVRIELVSIVTVLKSLRDPSLNPDLRSYFESDINDVCPTTLHCPGGMRRLLEYIRGVRKSEIPVDEYDRIEEYLNIPE
jgi:hypothetical protein